MRKKKCNRACQEAFEAALPWIMRHCEVQFRNVRCQSAREELTAEAVALSWKWWCRLVEKGRDPTRFVSAIATFAVKAARSGRRVCGQDRAKDVMSPRAQQLHSFAVGKLPDFSTLSGNPLAEALTDTTQMPPDELAAFRNDFPAWLSTWDAFRRDIILMMISGERTSDIAEEVGKSQGRISQMRAEFFFSWSAFVGE